MNRSYRTRHASGMPGWGPTPGWAQPPLPGWSPLADHGSLPVRVAGSVARWWWPTLALASFGAVAGFVLGHQPGPNLSTRGLFTIALAAVVVILLSIHRAAGPGPLARATAEYTVVALLAALLILVGGLGQPPPKTTSSSANSAPTATPSVNADQDQPGVLRVASAVTRVVTKAIRAVTGAAGWLADLWSQADDKTDHPSRSPATIAPQRAAMPSSPTTPPSMRRYL
jgi:amino acid transporter